MSLYNVNCWTRVFPILSASGRPTQDVWPRVLATLEDSARDEIDDLYSGVWIDHIIDAASIEAMLNRVDTKFLLSDLQHHVTTGRTVKLSETTANYWTKVGDIHIIGRRILEAPSSGPAVPMVRRGDFKDADSQTVTVEGHVYAVVHAQLLKEPTFEV